MGVHGGGAARLQMGGCRRAHALRFAAAVDQADAGQIKVSPNGSSGAGSGRFGEERNPDGTKKLPKQVRELADGVAKGLSKVDSKEVPLNCAAAVDNIRSQVDTMVENGQKNLKGGYITQAQFDATAGKFREARTHATVADCQASTGRSRPCTSACPTATTT